jgi:hypothetical protein
MTETGGGRAGWAKAGDAIEINAAAIAALHFNARWPGGLGGGKGFGQAFGVSLDGAK